MTKHLSLSSLLLVGVSLVALPQVGYAQSAVPPPVESASVTPAPAPLDEARIKALIDMEVARILEARALDAAAAAVVAPAAAPPPTSPITGGNGFVDVRLNLTFGNENMLVGPGETIPSIPGWRFGAPTSMGILFFENYDTRFSGYENLSHQVLYRNYRKDHIEAEGALVLRNIYEDMSFRDGGSYLSVGWWQDPTHKGGNRVRFTGFPNSADRFRLGYSYRLSWGGDEVFARTRRPKPGVKIQWDNDQAYAFVGAKTAVYLDPKTKEEVSTGGVMFGGGMDVHRLLRVEANGGFFRRGNNELSDVLDESVDLYGASVQVALHDGMPIKSSIDYRLYKYDADRAINFFAKTKYGQGWSYLVMSEATLLGQTLKDPERTGSTTRQVGKAFDMNVRVAHNRTRFQLDAMYRDLAFLLHAQPGLPTYSDFPAAYDVAGNYFAAAGVDHNWRDMLTVGLQLGIERPASLTSPSGIAGAATAADGETTAVIRSLDRITVLPVGETVLPSFAGKLSAQLDFAEYFSLLGTIYYGYDGNQTRLQRDNSDGLFRYEFGQFSQLGTNVTLQARF